MKNLLRFAVLSVCMCMRTVIGGDFGAYEVDSIHVRRADSILNSSPPNLAFPNPHPDAQWYTTARRGIMLHWGIFSVESLEPSWAMMRNFQWVSNPLTREEYYALAERFNPSDYDPEKWAAAWKKAGMTYAILTTKHHDGYALWPTNYGNMSTRVYMDGRDLVKPYVEACRKYGIRVGLYFSQPDWHYPGYRGTNVALVDGQWVYDAKPPPISAEENQRRFKQFYAYVVAQLEELLTRYGTIDLLWFDGDIWLDAGGGDVPEKTMAWIRSLHPGIVINERFGGTGDFISYEIKEPVNPPPSWWEYIGQFGWGAGWGPASIFASPREFVARTNEMNEMGGNFTPNMSPMADGTYHPEFYELCDGVEKIIALDASTPTQAPANVKALSESHSRITVSWDPIPPGADPEAGISAYRIYRNDVNGLHNSVVFHGSRHLLRCHHPLPRYFSVDLFSVSGARIQTVQGSSAGMYDMRMRGTPRGLYVIEIRTRELKSTRKLVVR